MKSKTLQKVLAVVLALGLLMSYIPATVTAETAFADAVPNQPYSIPAFTGELQRSGEPTTIAKRPQTEASGSGGLVLDENAANYGITAAPPAYGIDLENDGLYYWADVSVPGTSSLVGIPAVTSAFAGDFMGNNFGTLYLISYDNNRLYSVNTATAVATQIGTTNPPTGTFSGLAGGPDVMYGVTTNCGVASTLVTVDLATAAVTTIGTLTNSVCLIDLTYVPQDGMLYGIDLQTDSLHRINPATGADTIVGSTGFDANYAQGMDYDEVNNVFYWAACNDTTTELRIVDINTGASTRVGAHPHLEIDAFSVAAAAGGDFELVGTVTATGGAPIEDANVLITGGSYPISLYTDELGQYSAAVDAGTYSVTASKAGYIPLTKPAVVPDDATAAIVVDFELEVIPEILVSGVVYDGGVEGGAAHGYPLYTKMTFTATDFEEIVYSDPFTGEYEVTLFTEEEFNVKIEAMVSGYPDLLTTITPTGTISYEQDFYLYVNAVACSAPGYALPYEYFFDFESGPQGFTFGGTNSSWAWGEFTSGPGFAFSGTHGIATNPAGDYNVSELSWAKSPVIDLSGLAPTETAFLDFWNWLYTESATSTWDVASVEFSKNGGTTWATVWGPFPRQDTAYRQEKIVIAPEYQVSDFQFRFWFKSDSSGQRTGWYIDNIGIGWVEIDLTPTPLITYKFDDAAEPAWTTGKTGTGANSWAQGVPTTGPGNARSAPNVWATNLNGYYNTSEVSFITSPVIDLSAYSNKDIVVSYYDWLQTESATSNYDVGRLKATKDGTTFVTLLDNIRRKDVVGAAYTPQSIKLDSSFATDKFQFRFEFKSDSSGSSYYGWYIDDVTFSTANRLIIDSACAPIPGGVVAGYVYDKMVDDTKLYGAKVESADAAAFTGENTGHPASDGLYWVFQPFQEYEEEPQAAAGIQDLNGSFIEFDPSVGGDEGYTPGEPGTFCFRGETFTTDWEWGSAEWLKFPEDWTVTNVVKQGTGFCDVTGTVQPITSFTFDPAPNAIKIVMSRRHANPVDHCTAFYCVSATPGANTTNGLVSWYFDGDGSNDAVNHPCSSDIYTPPSMSSSPCDQHIKPQASIPRAIYSEEILFTASNPSYETVTEPVQVKLNTIVQKDWELGTGLVIADPTALERTMFLFDDPEFTTLDLVNVGYVDAAFTVGERNMGFQPYHIPPFEGELDGGKAVVSTADTSASIFASDLQLQSAGASVLQLEGGPMAYVVEVRTNDKLFRIPDITIPGTWEPVAAAGTYYAGDFLRDDYSKIYAISDTNAFVTIDTATGAATPITQLTIPGGGGVQGIAGAEGFFYGTTSDCTAKTDIFTLTPTGEVEVIVNTSIACGIDLAYVPDNGLLYTVDIASDHLYSINPVTGEVIDVGALGFAAGYAQGMDYDEVNKILYWAAYGSGGNGQLRVIDMETGASALVGPFTGDNESDCLAIQAYAGGGGGGGAVPWLTEDPIEGVIPVGGTFPIEIEFNVDGIEQPGEYYAQLIINTDTPYDVAPVPVTMHVLRPLNWGNIKGNVYAYEKCDVNPAPVEEATINFYRNGELVQTAMTDENGYFSHALLNGTYDVEFVLDGYVSQMITGVVLGWDAEVILDDVYLRLDAACLLYAPQAFFQELYPNEMAEQVLTFTNLGSQAAVFEITEKAGAGPVPFALNTLAEIELVLDDGSAEDAIGIGGSSEFIFLNRFTPAADQFPLTLEEVQVSFEANGAMSVGDDFRIVIYQNTTGGSNPAIGSELLYQFDVTAENITTWNSYPIPEPVTFEGPGDILIGVIAMTVPGSSYFPASIDTNASQQRSWAGWWSGSVPSNPVLPPDESWMLIDDFMPGNWMVRGIGTTGGGGGVGGDIIWLTVDPMADVVLPDGGTVDVTLTFDSTDLTWGDYFGTLEVINFPDPKISIPVQLRVRPYNIQFLPLILRDLPVPAKN